MMECEEECTSPSSATITTRAATSTRDVMSQKKSTFSVVREREGGLEWQRREGGREGGEGEGREEEGRGRVGKIVTCTYIHTCRCSLIFLTSVVTIIVPSTTVDMKREAPKRALYTERNSLGQLS